MLQSKELQMLQFRTVQQLRLNYILIQFL